MYNMTTKDLEKTLSEYEVIKAAIKNNKIKLESLRYEDGLTGISYDTEPTSKTNKFSSATENVAERNIQMEERLKRRIATEENKIKMIDNALEGLNDMERVIVEEFYINGLEWWKVAAKVCYSEGWCKSTRNNAIKKILYSINGD
ncbi:hypothetical protein EUAN_12500 [Andreesenia angusta]|uniref:Uncharacterized protein n=1 Tax=Andreesenia angusta TaxID=39480 RepID=A0A1S1V6B9_9FIRM|nr:hypothetical protein [Andreesenia angusta]OHW62181.1 hypothetical protein EUAN_12500 [Andreesenia angusta]